jgi:hypothetical protein
VFSNFAFLHEVCARAFVCDSPEHANADTSVAHLSPALKEIFDFAGCGVCDIVMASARRWSPKIVDEIQKRMRSGMLTESEYIIANAPFMFADMYERTYGDKFYAHMFATDESSFASLVCVYAHSALHVNVSRILARGIANYVQRLPNSAKIEARKLVYTTIIRANLCGLATPEYTPGSIGMVISELDKGSVPIIWRENFRDAYECDNASALRDLIRASIWPCMRANTLKHLESIGTGDNEATPCERIRRAGIIFIEE